MWNATRKMAEAIAEGIRQADPNVTVKLMNSAKEDKNDILTEVFRSKAILVGSPTINNGHLFSVGGLLEMIKGLKFKNKSAAAFGSYGWSGEAVKQMSKALEESGFRVVDGGHRALWVPDEAERSACVEYGKAVYPSPDIPSINALLRINQRLHSLPLVGMRTAAASFCCTVFCEGSREIISLAGGPEGGALRRFPFSFYAPNARQAFSIF